MFAQLLTTPSEKSADTLTLASMLLSIYFENVHADRMLNDGLETLYENKGGECCLIAAIKCLNTCVVLETLFN